MIENAYYSPELHGPYEMFDLGDFTLEEGPTLRGCQLAYATFGELNDAKDNAIFISTWYSGTHQIWADAYIDPEHALNSEKYFIVVANQIGNGLSTSPHNAEGPFSRGRFPHVSNEEVREGLARHAKIWSVMGYSTEFWKQEHWRSLGFTSVEDFQIGFMEAYFQPMDPNDLLCMAWKWQRGDVSRHTDGDLEAALGRITAKTFVMPIDEDMFFPVRDCEAEQAMIPNSELRVVESISGHLGLFNLEPSYMEQVDRNLGELLEASV